LVEQTGVPRENHLQTLSHNVVSSTPYHEGVRTHNISGDSNECTDSCKSNYHTMTVTADPQLFVVGFMSCCCLCVSLRILVFNIMPYHIILRFYFSVLWCPLHFQHKNDFLFIPTPICFYEDSCLIYAICVCLCIVAHLFCIQHVLTMSSMAGVLFIRDMSCLLSANACTVHFVFVWGSCILTFV
jgi:hypothetical protein